MRALGASVRVFAVVDRESTIPTDTGVPVPLSVREGTVRFESVTFAYPSRPEVKVLKNFSFEMPVGGSTAIVLVRFIALLIFMLIYQICSGKSGSGKSSIQSLLLRFYDPLEGKITFNGQGNFGLKFDLFPDSFSPRYSRLQRSIVEIYAKHRASRSYPL